jgi:2,3-dihydroxyphenylpropionate 1,2-dioxygenase
MMTTVVGGAMLPHAPQFFTMPDTEDKKNVQQVRDVAAKIGDQLRALDPDLWIIFSNDHAEQFFHNAAAKRQANSPGANSTGRFRARSASKSCVNYIARISIRRLPAPLISTTRSAFR